MRPRLISLGVLLTEISIFGVVTPAIAQSYPFCLGGNASYSLRCDYATLEQCQATAFGGQGYCIKDPYASNASTRAITNKVGKRVR